MRTSLTLSQMIEALFGIRTISRENPLVDEVNIAVTRIVPNNPKRVGLNIINLSLNSIYVSPSNRVSNTRGIWLVGNGGSMTLVWDRDFELCTREWFGTATLDGSTIYVLEYVGE